MDARRNDHVDQADPVAQVLIDDRSRRQFVQSIGRALGVATAVAVLPLGGRSSAGAHTASSEALPPAVAEWVAGWETLDAARMAATFTEDGVLEAVPLNAVVRGHAAIEANLEELFAAFSEATARMPVVFAAGDHAAAEWTFEGSYNGQLTGMSPGRGQHVAFRGVSVLELTNGAIQRNTRYFDLFGLLLQTGAILPEAIPGPGATPAS
jgi:steroid delta-isomerase-like uncharacterized protein